MTAGWAQALDRYAERLDRLEGVLARGLDLELPPFEPPDGLGRLPVELQDRAVGLLRRGVALQLELQAAANRVARELVGIRRARGAQARPSARLLDRRA